MGQKGYTEEEVQERCRWLRELREAGMSREQCATELGWSDHTVRNWIHRCGLQRCNGAVRSRPKWSAEEVAEFCERITAIRKAGGDCQQCADELDLRIDQVQYLIYRNGLAARWRKPKEPEAAKSAKTPVPRKSKPIGVQVQPPKPLHFGEFMIRETGACGEARDIIMVLPNTMTQYRRLLAHLVECGGEVM